MSRRGALYLQLWLGLLSFRYGTCRGARKKERRKRFGFKPACACLSALSKSQQKPNSSNVTSHYPSQHCSLDWAQGPSCVPGRSFVPLFPLGRLRSSRSLPVCYSLQTKPPSHESPLSHKPILLLAYTHTLAALLSLPVRKHV